MSPKRETPDTHEIDALIELERSEGYKLFRERVDDMIVRRCRELEGELDEVKTARVRGQIAALRDVLTVPVILKAEIQQSLKLLKKR